MINMLFHLVRFILISMLITYVIAFCIMLSFSVIGKIALSIMAMLIGGFGLWKLSYRWPIDLTDPLWQNPPVPAEPTIADDIEEPF